MSRKLIQTKPTTLSYGISSSATAMRLDALYKLDGTSISASDIGDLLYGTFDPGTSREEIFSIVGANVTVNSDGTLDITSVVRGLKEVDPYGTGGFSIDHPAGAIVVFGDNPQVFAEMAQLANDNAFTGDNTVPNPVGAQSIVPRDWILALINGGAISQNALVEAATAGETIAAGNLVYFNETENEWMKADGDLIATLFNVKMGIAMGAGTDGNAIAGGVLTRGSYTTSGLTLGDICYASNTAGGINSGTPGTVPRVIGIAKSTTVLYFDPDFQNRLYDYAVDAVGTDAYAITLPGGLSVPYIGMELKFKAGTANTDACTLAINGGSPIAIKKNVSVDLATGDILANQIVKVIYDGTVYQMLSMAAGTVSNIQIFTGNGTWTKPNGAKLVSVVAIGGGGGGAGGSTFSGAGGGGGALNTVQLNAAFLTPTVAVTIGGGGAGGAAGGNNGVDGVDTTFASYLTAAKGVKGTYNAGNGVGGTGGVASSPNGISGGAGGTCSGNNIGGGGGGAGGGAGGAGGTGTAGTAGTTFSSLGAGGAGSNTNLPGVVGANYGGGGGGGGNGTTNAGGNGGPGYLMVITYF